MAENSYKITELRQIGNAVQWMIQRVERGLSGGAVVVSLGREGRTDDQNDRTHPMIRDIMNGIDHPILGKNETQWRYFLVAQWAGQTMVPSLDGQQLIVVANKGVSQMTRADNSSFIEYLFSVGADHNIPWSDPSLAAYETITPNN